MFLDKYRDEVDDILKRYPPDQKRSAVMPLLYIAQREFDGYVPPEAMDDIAEVLGITATQVASIVGFYTLYYEEKEGKYRIQICTDLPCALRGADQFAREVYDLLGVGPGGTTDDGVFTVEEVMCLAACDRAPMYQVQSGEGIAYHEHQTIDDVKALVAELRAKAAASQTESE